MIGLWRHNQCQQFAPFGCGALLMRRSFCGRNGLKFTAFIGMETEK
jgi:hypothetical protein